MKLPSFKVNMIIPLIDKLRQEHRLSTEEYKALLLCQDADTLKYLQEQAREVSLEQFGNRVFIRGLIEITNTAVTIAIIAVYGKEINLFSVMS